MRLKLAPIVCLLCSFGAVAQLGNYKYENYGSRSILLSGSVTGSVEDLELTYYNPARLAQVDNPLFSINAKAYQLSNLRIEDAFGNETILEGSNFEGIPSMLVGTVRFKNLEDHYFAYSFITKSRYNVNLGFDPDIQLGDVIPGIPGIEEYTNDVNLDNSIKEEWIGATWAHPLNETMSIGVSLFYSSFRYSQNNSTKFAARIESPNDDVILYNQDIGFTQKSDGLFSKVGFSWKLPKFDLGLNISLPYLEILSDGDFRYEEFLSGTDNDLLTKERFGDLDARRKVPLSLALGAGIPIGKSKISANLEWYNGVNSYTRISIPELESNIDNNEELEFNLDEELTALINFAVGVEIYISPRISAFGSFSTDFSAYEDNPNIFDLIDQSEDEIKFSTDYYHFGLGGELKFSWADLILGANYTGSSSNFRQPQILPDPIRNSDPEELATLRSSRWQFIIGIDIPFFTRQLEGFRKSSSDDPE